MKKLSNKKINSEYVLRIIFIVAFIVMLICIVAYYLSGGASISPDGTLEEMFFFIPIAYLGLFAGIISGIALLIIKKIKTEKERKIQCQ